MNIPALKAFAPKVRRQLIEVVTLQLNHALTARTPDYLDTFAPQVAALRELERADRNGLIERVAYTWFNRLTALRFLDARGWHPFGARVLTPATPDETQPELLKLIRSGHCPAELQRHFSLDRVNGLLDGRIPSNDPQGEAYRHLVLAACHFYHALLPDIFERLDDETELLLPNDLLTEQSVAQGFRLEVSDEDCSEVEVLGWLYQFYISEKKDQVMARKAAVPTADIPAVTQLFTPHWIVRYLVENSLGRLWLLNHPESHLRAQMPYYIEGEPETDFLRISRAEEIKICDPAVGSGHMLTYAFELLNAIYEEQGYAPNEIPALILRNNLHGLDICPRAAQLAELALVFKAREKSSRFFRPGNLVQPHILALRDLRFAGTELRDYVEALRLGDLFNEPMLMLLHQFEEATTFGSLIEPSLDEQQISFARGFIEVKDLGGHLFLHETHQKVLRVLGQAEMLTQRYHVVVTNPPYMGGNAMSGELKQFAKNVFPNSKADLFAMFMERGFSLLRINGYLAMITMQNWMFLSSFEQLRKSIVSEKTFLSMAHLGARAFDSIGGEIVQSAAFVLVNASSALKISTFFRLVDGRSEADKSSLYLEAISDPACGWCFRIHTADLEKIPGSPIAYWARNYVDLYVDGATLSSFHEPKKGILTSDNDRFLRRWFEVSQSKFNLTCRSCVESEQSGSKWFPMNKGGAAQRWYGNHEYVMNWEFNGREMREWERHIQETRNAGGRVINEDFYFKEGVTWSDISSSQIAFRYLPEGFIFNARGPAFFLTGKGNLNLLGYVNSSVVAEIIQLINPTICLNPTDVGRLPVPRKVECAETVSRLIDSARTDWNNFERSWDFLNLPLLRPCLKGTSLEASWRNWEVQCFNAIRHMQKLEIENNRLFIEAYGLTDELTPDVPDDQITLARADARRDMTAFLSYAVGCMMGRYSLDRPGLILANAGESVPDYLAKVGLANDQLTFAPSEDGIIPVLDGEWFEGDIVARTREFLRATFGEATLRENIRFIEESLGRELRSYFLTEFYKDHLQTYKKRPIYWMIQSPRFSVESQAFLVF